jgi:hypothetical protein
MQKLAERSSALSELVRTERLLAADDDAHIPFGTGRRSPFSSAPPWTERVLAGKRYTRKCVLLRARLAVVG